jgi:DNA (cytosine-5)-methyltransferase 1|tara:strand:- start:3243 stop:3998 length:756 start_codon:yes stop_codon:yes gene_type:complete
MKHLDLFSGIGGFSLGLEKSGFKTVGFCEIEKYPRKVLKQNWPDVKIYKDIRDVTGETLKADGIIPEIVTGGFPCTDISHAGDQKGIDGEKSGLWSELHRVISEVQPNYAIMENVTNLIAGDRGRWFGRVLGDLAQIGFDAQWHCIQAARLNALHRRDRIWIIAYPNGKGLERQREIASRISTELNDFSYDCEWPVEPKLDRMAYGLPARIHRIKGLGNAIVPQMAQLIGNVIKGIDDGNIRTEGPVSRQG